MKCGREINWQAAKHPVSKLVHVYRQYCAKALLSINTTGFECAGIEYMQEYSPMTREETVRHQRTELFAIWGEAHYRFEHLLETYSVSRRATTTHPRREHRGCG